MVITRFPPVESADRHGLLAVGGDVEVPSLLLAYKSGIFPWPIEEDVLTWFAPPRRALLFLDRFHAPRSLLKMRKREAPILEIRFDHDFETVIRACSELENRGKQQGTWITQEMIAGYIELHKAGYAHSVECYVGGELRGGLYGVSIGRMFAGESMFYRYPNASKYCLLALVERLVEKGVPWIDCQVMTPFFESLGAVEVSRKEFMRLLSDAIAKPADIFG